MFSQSSLSQQENNLSIQQATLKLDSNRQRQKFHSENTLDYSQDGLIGFISSICKALVFYSINKGGQDDNNSNQQMDLPKKQKKKQNLSDLESDEDNYSQSYQQSTNLNSKLQQSKANSQIYQSRNRIKSQFQSDQSDEGFEDSQEMKRQSDSDIEEQKKSQGDLTFPLPSKFFQGKSKNNQHNPFPYIIDVEARNQKKQVDRLPSPPILDQQYSLVPDMIAGWRPKFSRDAPLPPPIPLSFDDENLDYIIEKLLKTNRYTILYLGFRPKTSYDFHREYSGKANGYNFKYGNILLQKNVLSQFNIHVETENVREITNDNKSDDQMRKRPFIGMNPQYPKNLMQFDSMFEGGNIDCVIKLSDQEFDLYMRIDSNTKGHLQWYNFKVLNAKKGDKIKINIQNFTKKRSLYQRVFIIFFSFYFYRGWRQFIQIHLQFEYSQIFQNKFRQVIQSPLQICAFYILICFLNIITRVQGLMLDHNRILKRKRQIGTKQDQIFNTNKEDFLNMIIKIASKDYFNQVQFKFLLLLKRKIYFVLSFEYQFEFDNDEVQFAQIPPYTYTNLINLLKPLNYNQLSEDGRNQYMQEQTICKSLSGIPVQLLTITDYIDQTILLNQRKVIVIVARIHPGEVTGSWMCQGLIESLLSQNQEIQQIRKKVIFKIIPMMNPDGVILGNYRTGLAGLDLNRQFGDGSFATTNNQLFPSVNGLKQLVKDLKEQYGNNMLGFIDLHGHSIKKNIFTFGPYYPPTDFRYYRSKFIPKLIEKHSEYFRFYSCTYNSQKSNKSTARVAFLNKYNLEICYTIEATFGLYYKSDSKTTQQMISQDWIKFGTQLPFALKQYIEMMDTYNVIKEAQEQKMQQEKQLNISPLKRNTNQSPNRASTIKIKSQQSFKDSDISDFIPFDESQVYNLGGLLKEIQNDERQLTSSQTNLDYADSSDNYSDFNADSEPSDEDIPLEKRNKLFSNIDNYQKNFTKFIMGKKKKEKLIIEGGEDKRDKIITHKLKRSAISVDNRENKKKKGKKKKKEQTPVLQSENVIGNDADDLRYSLKRLEKIRLSSKIISGDQERGYPDVLSSQAINQKSQMYLEDEDDEQGASNMFLADLKKKKKARIRLKVQQNNSMIANMNEIQNYNAEQNVRGYYNEEEDDQLTQFKIMHLSKKYNSNVSHDTQIKNQISPQQGRYEIDSFQQFPEGYDQSELNQNSQDIFSHQFKSNLPHYYKRIPKNRVPMKLNIICDKFQTSNQKQQHVAPNPFIQQSNPYPQQDNQQYHNNIEQTKNQQNINYNPYTYRQPVQTNHNEEYFSSPSPNYKSRMHENLYNQIISSAIKGNITHKNDNKQNQSYFQEVNSPQKNGKELKLPIIENRQGRGISHTMVNMTNRNNKAVNIYQMPIMEQSSNDILDIDQFKKEILKYKRDSHFSNKPLRSETKNIQQFAYSVSPNQLRGSTNNLNHQIQQYSQMMPSLPRYNN